MNTVEPIRSTEIIAAIKRDLKERSYRDYGLFITGINSALRISDIVKLQVLHMKKPELYIRTTKTGKEIFLPISDYLRRELRPLMEGRGDHEYLFLSRQRKKKEGLRKSIDRSVAYRLLNRIGKKYGLERIGCHTLRKTFAYHHWKKNKNTAILKNLLGHQDESHLLRYIGIIQDDINSSMKGWHL
ncbi:tyrosine-type recombinase/integrase [Paenibacillus sp. UNC451MF]|uniref:tyrosine-type recombinase/integrase n=1 Tax=Paenibacillus sp. UNC451MF TaxID=1449063 RepID=UPI00048AC104|nr:tyrosine-type recombinase/integrase [Paenibacillus sp. UNC451MF]